MPWKPNSTCSIPFVRLNWPGAILRRAMSPLYRGVNRVADHEILEQVTGNRHVILLNNLSSFTCSREQRACEFMTTSWRRKFRSPRSSSTAGCSREFCKAKTSSWSSVALSKSPCPPCNKPDNLLQALAKTRAAAWFFFGRGICCRAVPLTQEHSR